MDQQDKTPERIEPLDDLICLSTGYNLMSVTISESAFEAQTDFCFRVNNMEDFNKLDYLIRRAIKANILLVLDPDEGERKTINYLFKEEQKRIPKY